MDCFTPKVLEADCDNTPITFLTTEIEGVDDTKTPPENGAYRNTIVKYLMTGNTYLYDSMGIPVIINTGTPPITVDSELSDDSTNPVENRVITQALNYEIEAREALDTRVTAEIKGTTSQLSNELEEERQARKAADEDTQTRLQGEIEAREALGDRVNTAETNISELQEEISNLPSGGGSDRTVLYSGSSIGPTFNLSESFKNFEYIEIVGYHAKYRADKRMDTSILATGSEVTLASFSADYNRSESGDESESEIFISSQTFTFASETRLTTDWGVYMSLSSASGIRVVNGIRYTITNIYGINRIAS